MLKSNNIPYVLYIALLVMFVAVMGFNYLILVQLPRQRYVFSSILKENAHKIIHQKRAALENWFSKKTQKAFYSLNPSKLHTFTSLPQKNDLVQVAFLLDENLNTIVPAKPLSFSWEEKPLKTTRFFELGQKNEFASPPRYKEALKFYQLALNKSSNTSLDARILVAMSVCCFRLQNHTQAFLYTKQAIKKMKQEQISPYLQLCIWYWNGKILSEQKHPLAAKTLLQFYKRLVQGEFPLRSAQYLYWQNKLEGLLYKNIGHLSKSQRLLWQHWRKKSALKKAQDNLYKLLNSSAKAQIKRKTLHKTAFQCLFLQNKSFFVCQKNRKKIMGFQVNKAAWEKKIEELFVAHDFIIFLEKSKKAKPLVAISSNIFPHFKMMIAPKDAQILEKKIHREKWLTILTTSIITLLLVIGAYLVFRSFKREIELSRLKSNFVACISHELRTPLALIQSHSETLFLQRVREEKKLHYYKVITRESERLMRLIQNILNLSKIEAGKFHVVREKADIASMFADLIEQKQSYWPYYQGQIVLQVQENLPLFFLDHNAIRSAIFNLLDNAIKYSEKSSDVYLGAKLEKEHLYLWVQDKGVGIDAKEHKKIFEQFYRVDKETFKRGTGVGLSMVYHIVKAHKGRIAVESTPQQGSLFQIWLPL